MVYYCLFKYLFLICMYHFPTIGESHFAVHMYTNAGLSLHAGKAVPRYPATKGEFWVRLDAVDNSKAVMFVPTGASFAEAMFVPVYRQTNVRGKLQRISIILQVSEDGGDVSPHNFNLGRIILAAFNRGRSPSGCTVEHVTNDPAMNCLMYVTRGTV